VRDDRRFVGFSSRRLAQRHDVAAQPAHARGHQLLAPHSNHVRDHCSRVTPRIDQQRQPMLWTAWSKRIPLNCHWSKSRESDSKSGWYGQACGPITNEFGLDRIEGLSRGESQTCRTCFGRWYRRRGARSNNGSRSAAASKMRAQVSIFGLQVIANLRHLVTRLQTSRR
jgi:hypothetical protein